MRRISALVLVSVFLSLQACGGGGGGSSSGASSSNQNLQSFRDGKTAIRVLHSALDLPPVQTYINSEPLQKVTFVPDAFYTQVSDGEVSLEAFNPYSQTVIGSSHATTLAKGDGITLLVYGSIEQGNLNSSLISDALPELEAGFSSIRIINGVSKTGTIEMVLTGSDELLTATLGAASARVNVAAGVVKVTVQEEGSSVDLFTGPLTLEEGKSYSLLIAGEDGLFVFGKLYQD